MPKPNGYGILLSDKKNTCPFLAGTLLKIVSCDLACNTLINGSDMITCDTYGAFPVFARGNINII